MLSLNARTHLYAPHPLKTDAYTINIILKYIRHVNVRLYRFPRVSHAGAGGFFHHQTSLSLLPRRSLFPSLTNNKTFIFLIIHSMPENVSAPLSVLRMTTRGQAAPFRYTFDEMEARERAVDQSAHPWIGFCSQVRELIMSEEDAAVRGLDAADYTEREFSRDICKPNDSDRLGKLLLNELLVDKLIYAANDDPHLQMKQTFLIEPQKIEQEAGKPKDAAVQVYENYLNWPDFWKELCDAWEGLKINKSLDQGTDIQIAQSTGSARHTNIARKLMTLADSSEHKRGILRAEGNIYIAALGLLALVMVSPNPLIYTLR
jgi:hypothetical protein